MVRLAPLSRGTGCPWTARPLPRPPARPASAVAPGPAPAEPEGPRSGPRALTAVLLGAAAACGPAPEGPPGGAGRWNVVLVTLDTTRPDFLTPWGADAEVSPRLEELAGRSTVFTNALSETNVTSPSHLTILSGLRAVDHGVLNNASQVPRGVDTLPEAFQRAGYATAGFPAVRHVGWGMGWRGFDQLGPGDPPPDAAAVTEAAEEWIRAHADGPFFAWVHYFDPHAVYAPPLEIAQRFYSGDPRAGEGPPLVEHEYFRTAGEERLGQVQAWLTDIRDPEYPVAMYTAELHYVDRELGRLLDALDELTLTERTLVVVVADHGESLGEHGIHYAHRGVYEPQLRIPLLVSVPGRPAGRSDAFATTLDVAPTLRELTGIGPAGPLPGRSLVPFLGGGGPDDAGPPTFVHQNARNHVVAVRHAGWKLVWPVTADHWLLGREPELFHVAEDPLETRDRAGSEPERVEALRALGAPWIELGTLPATGAVRPSEADVENLRRLGYLDD